MHHPMPDKIKNWRVATLETTTIVQTMIQCRWNRYLIDEQNRSGLFTLTYISYEDNYPYFTKYVPITSGSGPYFVSYDQAVQAALQHEWDQQQESEQKENT